MIAKLYLKTETNLILHVKLTEMVQGSYLGMYHVLLVKG